MNTPRTITRKELVYIPLLTVLIAFMDITGIPSVFFTHWTLPNIEPIYVILMVNFLIIGAAAYLVLKYLCPGWDLGLHREGLLPGLRRYGASGVLIAAVGFLAFYAGLAPLDLRPPFGKVLIEGVVYYIGVAIVEELYIRGLLLNYIERLLTGRKNSTRTAVIASSVIFGLGHIFGVAGQPLLVIVSKVLWTVCMGIYLGAVYKKSGNLWLPICIHFLINICALPYCFSSVSGYADLTLYIIVPAYLILGGYGLRILKTAD